MGGLLSTVMIAAGWLLLCGTEDPEPAERLRQTLFYFGPALVWSAGLVLCGMRILMPG